jgi:hypothetical protein
MTYTKTIVLYWQLNDNDKECVRALDAARDLITKGAVEINKALDNNITLSEAPLDAVYQVMLALRNAKEAVYINAAYYVHPDDYREG